MRRGTFLAEEVLMSSNARRGSLFASVVKHGDPTEAPTIAKVHLFAAVLFVVGSLFFVYQGIADNWLFHYRIGCALFIIGCVAYLVAMGMAGGLLDENLSSRVSDMIIIAAMVLFIVGCVIAFHPGGEKEVLRRMDLMNYIFLVGSVLLFFDATKCAISSRIADALTLGNYLNIATTTSFVAAAILGGKFYRATPFIVEEGMVMWLVGSSFCMVGPLRVLACGAYDPGNPPKKGVDSLYGSVCENGAPSDKNRENREDNLAYLRTASLPSNYNAHVTFDDSSDGVASSSEDDSKRPVRAFP